MKRLCLVLALVLVAQTLCAQMKVVEKSSKKAPSWIGVTEPDFIIVSAEDTTLDGAKDRCLAEIRQTIVNSVAVNISSKVVSFAKQEDDGLSTDLIRRYESHVESIAAKLPYVTGVTLDDAEIYWKRLYNKRDKSYKYELHAKYPFPILKRNGMIVEFLKQEKAQTEKLRELKANFDTFTEVEYIRQAVGELKTLHDYFVDEQRKGEAMTLMTNYQQLYKEIQLIPYANDLGEFVYYLQLGNRRVTTARKPTFKSQFATQINVTPTADKMYKVTYDYTYCQEGDENKIEIVQPFPSGAVKHTFYFDVTQNKVQVTPCGEIVLQIEPVAPASEATTADASVRITGWMDLRAKHTTPFEVTHLTFTASGTRICVDCDLAAAFSGEGNHRLHFTATGAYGAEEKRFAMAHGVVHVVNKATGEQREVRFSLPYKIVVH